jgi:alkylhydroperoxidase family enzyme
MELEQSCSFASEVGSIPVSTPQEELRAAVAALPPPPAAMAPYLDKVRSRAHEIEDADVEALKDDGFSEDEIFEQTVAAAVGEGFRRLEAGLRAVG